MCNKLLFLMLSVCAISYGQLFYENFNSSALSDRWQFESASPDRFEIVADPAGLSGDSCLKVSLKGGDLWGSSCRSETVLYNYDSLNTEVEYRFSILIPPDFLDTLPYPSNRHMIMQFHQIYEPGHSWATCNCGDQPVVSINLRKLNPNRYILNLKYGKNGWENDVYLTNSLAAIDTIERSEFGKWIDLTWRIKWSLDSTGYIEMWKDNLPWTPLNGTDYKFYGANMWNFVPCSFKMGLYRNPGNPTTNIAFFDNFSVRNNLPACPRPSFTNTSNVSSNSVQLNWEFVPYSEKYSIRYRILGAVNWNYVTSFGNANFFTLSNLQANSTYEWQIKSFCSETEVLIRSPFTPINHTPTNSYELIINPGEVKLIWDPVDHAIQYRVKSKKEGESVWTSFITQNEYLELNNLDMTNVYYWRVNVKCDVAIQSNFTAIREFSFDADPFLNEKVLNGQEPYSDLLLFPNPVQNMMNLEYLTEKAEIVNLKIYTIQGEQKLSKSVDIRNGNNRLSLDVTTFPDGFYFIEIYGSDVVFRKPFVKCSDK